MTRYYRYDERRGVVQDTHAARDEDWRELIFRPILASPERRGYAALVGITITALAALYFGAVLVCRARGWL